MASSTSGANATGSSKIKFRLLSGQRFSVEPLNSSLGRADGFALDSVGAKNINAYLIELLGPASHLPDHGAFPKRLEPAAKKAFSIRREATEVGRGARQEAVHLPLLIFFDASCTQLRANRCLNQASLSQN